MNKQTTKQITRLQEINRRGFAHGWHAEQLASQAKRNGCSMSDQFEVNMNRASNYKAVIIAYNVPGECIKVTKDYIYYRFSDGSDYRAINESGRV